MRKTLAQMTGAGRALQAAGVLCAALALVGCANVRQVDSQVESYSTLQAMPAPATYRFDRLPSQQTPRLEWVESIAQRSLARVGLALDTQQPRLIVQWNVDASEGIPDWPHYSGGWGLGVGLGRHPGIHATWMMRERPPTLYRRSLQLWLRDARTHQVVYETRVQYEDIWSDDRVVLERLFDAALLGFPNPPQGRRAVRLPMYPEGENPSAPAAPAPVNR